MRRRIWQDWTKIFTLWLFSDVTLVLEEDLKLVNPIVKQSFGKKVLPNLSLPGRLKHFHKNRELITRNPDLLASIKGFKTPLLSQPVQDYDEQDTAGTGASRDRDNVEKRSNIWERSYTGGVYKLVIPWGEKWQRAAPSDKFEESKFLWAILALQNEKLEFPPVSSQERRLYGQVGFEGCLLLCTSP